ncbi:5'-nucleotidase C-terminal domain-containing protein [Sedimentibacter sp. MB31-C6]|uniref:5'-nucleotidase C-terminal domain-containing protein n=1 Tax=Sedimentibacter sp. MB31-C6 TaxID=3109366 RepID=UPI002DDD0CBD|nr:5'-nucleotidase C-terminal domain-containing protein [Sedimentibacter sp. MB36-C1]WSI03312.1 5'-nucleotidase C-terminal domain-containing protein [Sedimentibacter sp. MB36-C1]
MKKKVLSLVLISLLILNSFSFVFAAEDETILITIIHTNDTHGRLEEDSYNNIMGFAKIATLIKEAKAENPNTLVLDAGDTLHGMPIVNISNGENSIKILEAAGYDYMAVGNHDFNYGQERLLELKDLTEIGMLSANVLKDDEYLFTPYVIEEIDGVKVGIFGLTTPETEYKTSPTNVEGITFADPIEVSKKMVDELDDQTDVIIALAHIGIDESSVVTSKAIAENVEGIDVIIDGHSHTLLENGMFVNDTLIAQTGEHDKNLGYINIEIQNGEVVNKTAQLLTSEAAANTVADPDLAKTIEEINAENEAVFSQVVAKTDIFLDGTRENVRTKETNLGNLSADAVRYAAGADIGFVNGGNIRISLEPGDITFGQLAELFPFGNTVQVKKITGIDLIKVLEQSVSGYPATQGGFLQVSGMNFVFDPSQPVGSRVVEVTVGDIPLSEDAEYTVAINDFLGIGGDGFDMFKDYPIHGEVGTYEEVFADYLNTFGTSGSEISGRITVKEIAPVEEPVPVEPPIDEPINPEPIPEPIVEPTEPAPELTEEIYIVISGDVLWKIAEKYNTTWEELSEYNKLANPHLIYPGDELKVPVK